MEQDRRKFLTSALTAAPMFVPRSAWGANDRMFPMEYAFAWQALIPGSQAVVIPECGHVPHLEKPDAFVRELVGFIEHGQIPPRCTKLLLQLFIARKLVQTDNELLVVLERIAAWRRLLQQRRVNGELKTKFFEKFVTPLLDQAARCDDQNATSSPLTPLRRKPARTRRQC